MEQAALEQIIAGIGCGDFAARSSLAVRSLMRFDLAMMVLHAPGAPPQSLFDDFAGAGFREGLETYLRSTHRINPILADPSRHGACRARDYGRGLFAVPEDIRDHIVLAHDEELGFRTIGWPRRMEEVGLYFVSSGGLVELSLYRERGSRGSVSEASLRMLGAMQRPLAAAFERDRALASAQGPSPPAMPRLSPRERQICELLLIGCSSTAIALRLRISPHTVKDHRKQLFRKLGIGSLPELFALDRQRRGLPLQGDG